MAPQEVAARTQLHLGELSASGVTHDSALLSWTVEEGTFDSFIIQYKDAEGKPQALPVDGESRSVTVTSLAPSRRYKFNLSGLSGRKRLGPVSADAVTAAAPPEEGAGSRLRLGELSASDVTHDSLDLSWTVEEGTFDSFILQYKDAEGRPQALPVDGGSRSVTVTSLAPSRRYKFNLYGVSGRKRLGPVSTEAVTGRPEEEDEEEEEEGGAPQPRLGDLSVSEVTKDSVRLSWTVQAGAFDSFLLQYKDAEGRPQALPAAGGSRSLVVSDLLPSRRYTFHLHGLAGRKRLGPVSADAVTASPGATSEAPARLEQLLVSDVTPTSLRLSWDAAPGQFDTFLVRYRPAGPGPAQEVPVPGTQRSAVLRGLRPATEYGLAVHGLQRGEETASVHGAARTGSLELESPRELRFSDVRETSVGVTWGAPATRVDHYKVSFQLTDGGEPQSATVEGGRLQTTLGGLTPGASYEVSVMAVRGFEESEPLVGHVTTAPDGPSDLRVADLAGSAALLRWRPARGPVQSYQLSYGPPQGPAVTVRLPGDRTEHPLSGLQLDTEYRVSVLGVSGGRASSPASASFTTELDAPRDLRATEVTPRSARLAWTPPRSPPAGYLLSYETPAGHTQEIPLGSDAASYQLQDLTPSSRYQVRLQAIRGGHPTTPIATSFNTVWLTHPFPRDCAEEQLNGPGSSREATIYLGGDRARPLRVFCDMETDGGGWLVFQRRMNGRTDFWRDWADYARGFGNVSQEFWLGNEALSALTAAGEQELRVDLRAGAEAVHAQYQRFRVAPASENYRLQLGAYRGTAGDALSYHSGSVFSTRDRDPNRLRIACAVSYRGAWWYRNCHYANLNGLYGNSQDHQGVNWFNWKGFEFSIPFTEMKLRPRRG